MPTNVKPVPEGFHTITPHLVIRGAAEAFVFYQKAFGAVAGQIHYMPGGKTVMHADLKIGDSTIFLNDEFPEMQALSPLARGGSSVTLHLYVENADAVYQRAVDAGCQVTFPLADQFWGDRYGVVRDPFGHNWSIGSRIAEPTEPEVEAAANKVMAESAKR